MLSKLYSDALKICNTHTTTNWSNSWMWKNGYTNNQENKLINYFLTYLENDGTFHYEDITDFDIELEFVRNTSKYRIDIKDRYKIHNFWLFEESQLPIVSAYVLKLIQNQYDTITKRYDLLDLSNGAYYDKVPDCMYPQLNKFLRKDKINKILQYESRTIEPVIG